MSKSIKKWFEYTMPVGGLRELFRITIGSWKIMLIFSLLINIGFVSVVACGRLSKTHLDGVVLATSTIVSFAMGTCWGLGSAFDTYFSQAFGSTQKKRVGVYLQTSLIFSGYLSLLCVAMFVNSYRIYTAIGQDEGVSRITEEYLCYASPGIPFLLAFVMLSKYMQAQGMTSSVLVTEVVGIIVNIALQYPLVYSCDLGIRGSAISHAAGFVAMFVLLLVYILLSRVHETTWEGWSRNCLEDWGSISRLIFSSVILVCSDWWYFVIGLFLVGTLGTVQLGASGILVQVLSLMYSFASGLAIQWTYMIGRSLGRGDVDSVRRYANGNVLLGMTVNLVTFSVMISLMTVVPKIFTDNRDIQQLTTDLFPLVAVYLLVDSMKTQMSGTLRGSGKQLTGALASFFLFTVLSFSIAVPLIYYTNLKSTGFWIGSIIGTSLCSLVFVVICVRIDWAKEVEKAAKRIERCQAPSFPDSKESTPLLDKGPRKPSQWFLVSTRLLVTVTFVAVFATSVTFRVIYPPYDASIMANSTNLF